MQKYKIINRETIIYSIIYVTFEFDVPKLGHNTYHTTVK